ESSVDAHAAIASAILKGDGGLARVRMQKHLEAEAAFLRRHPQGPTSMTSLPTIGRSDKLPELTARRLFELITEDGWQVGTVVGEEIPLMERYGVGRAVFREAVLLLEHLG